MNVVVLSERVSDTCSERMLRSDGAVDRDATDAVLDEMNEPAVEATLRLNEAGVGSGDGSEGAGVRGVAGQCQPHIGVEQHHQR